MIETKDPTYDVTLRKRLEQEKVKVKEPKHESGLGLSGEMPLQVISLGGEIHVDIVPPASRPVSSQAFMADTSGSVPPPVAPTLPQPKATKGKASANQRKAQAASRPRNLG